MHVGTFPSSIHDLTPSNEGWSAGGWLYHHNIAFHLQQTFYGCGVNLQKWSKYSQYTPFSMLPEPQWLIYACRWHSCLHLFVNCQIVHSNVREPYTEYSRDKKSPVPICPCSTWISNCKGLCWNPPLHMCRTISWQRHILMMKFVTALRCHHIFGWLRRIFEYSRSHNWHKTHGLPDGSDPCPKYF